MEEKENRFLMSLNLASWSSSKSIVLKEESEDFGFQISNEAVSKLSCS